MILPPGSRYEQWKYVEVANYVEKLDRVLRWQRKDKKTGERTPIVLTVGDEVEKFRTRNNNVGIYTSVFHTMTPDVVDVRHVGSMYFDLDAEDINDALADSKKLLSYLFTVSDRRNIRWYFTGMKGFHIEVEAAAMGVDPRPDLDKIYRFAAEQLKHHLGLATLDFQVYDVRRMWRLPNSIHQKSGKHKVLLPWSFLRTDRADPIVDFADAPSEVVVPNPSYHHHLNRWYKDWVVEHERVLAAREREMRKKRQDLYLNYGTRIVKPLSDLQLNKAWKHTIENLQEAAKPHPETGSTNRNSELNRQAYKMYLMYLRSQDDLEYVTTSLETLAHEIGLSRNEIRATLSSARSAAEEEFRVNPYGVFDE